MKKHCKNKKQLYICRKYRWSAPTPLEASGNEAEANERDLTRFRGARHLTTKNGKKTFTAMRIAYRYHGTETTEKHAAAPVLDYAVAATERPSEK